MLPQLREIEARYADRVVVIGVHSAKFPAERATEAVRQAVRRHAIRHPVVNDRDFRIWQEYACRAWPTLMFVDPRGKVIGRHEGEFEAGQLARVIDAMLAEFEAAGWLVPGALAFGAAGPTARTSGAAGTLAALAAPRHTQEVPSSRAGPLAFPGKVLVDDRGRGHVYVADSNHHRLVVMGLQVMDGAVHHVVGGGGSGVGEGRQAGCAGGSGAGGGNEAGRTGGESGLVDGPPGEARFNWPQGMALDPRTGVVYVADTENHCIRRVSPDGGRVTTIAGTGRQARSIGSGGRALDTALSSPWDVAFLPEPDAGPPLDPHAHVDPHDDRGTLFIAMAGLHQVWALDLARGTVAPFAGTGREALVDGPAHEACFAQPSGLSLDLAHRRLFVADSETSAVRAIDLESGDVSTLVGAGLFEFGDVDGPAGEARLQHPLGVCYWPDDPHGPSVLIGDTYNHRIKRYDLLWRTVRSFVGAGAPAGFQDGAAAAARFSEPGGLALARRTLFIADTNNHRVRVVNLATLQVGTLAIDESRRAHE